jgi:hypothetical protein
MSFRRLSTIMASTLIALSVTVSVASAQTTISIPMPCYPSSCNYPMEEVELVHDSGGQIYAIASGASAGLLHTITSGEIDPESTNEISDEDLHTRMVDFGPITLEDLQTNGWGIYGDHLN